MAGILHHDGSHRDKDSESRARHAEAEAARTRRRSRSYSPIRKRRRDSPSFMEPRRITRYKGDWGEKRLGLLTLIGSEGCQEVKAHRPGGLLEWSDSNTEERGGFCPGGGGGRTN